MTKSIIILFFSNHFWKGLKLIKNLIPMCHNRAYNIMNSNTKCTYAFLLLIKSKLRPPR